MKLNQYEENLLSGKQGAGRRKCMEILVKFGEAMGADHMIPLASAHTMPKEPLDLLIELTESVESPGTFTTLHPCMSAFSLDSWDAMGISDEFAHNELPIHKQRQEIYQRIGFYQTYTCLPMLIGNMVKRGDHVSWIGTGLQLLTNSLLGARTNRDGSVINLASAIVGRTPYYGFHLEENRKAQVQVNFINIEARKLTPANLGAAGYFVGSIAGSRNVVFANAEGLTPAQIRHLLPPLSVSGSVGICHIVGVTPEAPNLSTALGGHPPDEVIEVGPKQIEQERHKYALGSTVDLAIFGCSHCTIQDLSNIAKILGSRKIAKGKRLWIGTAPQTAFLARQSGIADLIESAGGVFAGACVATIPECPLPDGVSTVATNSFKAAHYISRLSKGKVKAWVADTKECIEAVLNR